MKQLDFPTGIFTSAEFTIIFTADEQIFVKREDEIMVEGVYKVSDRKIVLTDKRGARACLEPEAATGRYEWSFDGQRLTFVRIEDLCEGRIASLTIAPLVYSKNF